MHSVADRKLRATMPIGGGCTPHAASTAIAEQIACATPHTPQARLETNTASRASRPTRMFS